MGRLFKQDEYDAKRNEILDCAARMVYAEGYEQLSIQGLIDALDISRGALYHYFDSKLALIEAMVDRMGELAAKALLPVVDDQELSATQKFRRCIETATRVKSSQKELSVSLMRIWYSDDNAIIRQKMASVSLKWTAPIVFEPIIRQGIAEGVFTTPYPKHAARIIMGVALSLTDALIEPLLASRQDPSEVEELGNILNAYFDTIERVLGAQAGSLKTLQADDLKEWFVPGHAEGLNSEPSTSLASER